MLDTIYIIDEKYQDDSLSDEENKKYEPDFIIRNGETIKLNEQEDISYHIKKLTLSTAMLIAPLPSAIITSIMSFPENIVGLFSSKDEGTELSDEQAEIEYQKKMQILNSIQRLSLSPSKAKSAGYRFQPGHPLIGKAYKRHPLADYDEKNKANLYILSDCYNQILLEERESEMIKLLVHLGATKITITKKFECENAESSELQVGIHSNIPAGASAGYSERQKTNLNSMDTREFTLSGKTWTPESKVDRSQFFWLEYEPSWNAVVYARENGGCLTASLELKESTSFSMDKNIEANIKAKMLELATHANFEKYNTTDDIYYISAIFSSSISEVAQTDNPVGQRLPEKFI
ncbi:hypothetical protein [Dickeya solani]|uniref:Uncharacterized protein n=1 Tax=Dickeya solani TaxID=1089444 RepID=A0ABU4EA23_9GAMM|nr:hypothetical protein [Dickeya solani]MCA6998580.1 hypothetical protein [Dickeya solani]MCZ0822030.1 hypothetical protein [Dickeya solani]MDV6994871.1 hypothetical protein [Dickeya solani]MDV7004250.1 hypothetical protein [Dickeya solani]MDV7039579.1 hypothetical protein [Dickeya solani]